VTPSRVVLIVLDSVGIGELPDAAAYGDQGSNTIGNLARAVPLAVPTLRSLGLPRVVPLDGPVPVPRGAYGRMGEASAGKDSVTGHWEMAGIVLDRPFPTFPHGFPSDLLREFERRIGRASIGNVAASGTEIIDRLGPEHMRTGAPIVYTSADSVFQIAAHEAVISVDQLYAYCDVAYDLVVRGLGVGRVIARPFVGVPGAFVRTANRRDYALEPTGVTVLDRLNHAGFPVIGIGKIGDLFAGRGWTATEHAASDDDGLDRLERTLSQDGGGLVAINLVDFDTQYGHRNDVAGYATHLEHVDTRLGRIIARGAPGDVVIVTADHGNDPTTPSTDHSREYVPLFVVGSAIRAGVDLGTRATFADVGQTICEWFGVPPVAHGASFLGDLLR
jgi:phosphopentomutase